MYSTPPPSLPPHPPKDAKSDDLIFSTKKKETCEYKMSTANNVFTVLCSHQTIFTKTIRATEQTKK